MQTLPIDAILPEVLESLRLHPCLVLEAEAGAGKTTRVPPALLDAELFPGQLWVAEPRRIAARLVAHRVASERNEPLGRRIGYTVRFEDKTCESTRLRYVTSGILLRRLVADPSLSGIDCVILDEFHERHLDTDLSLALILRLQRQRPDLRLIVMSATLDGERIAEHLGNCPRLFSAGRQFPLTISHDATVDDRPLEKRVSSAVRSLIQTNAEGSILVFLPGATEIRRSAAQIGPLCEQAGFEVALLHGDLPIDEQARAIEPGRRPRVVLTTNVAESSVTVEGITAVVDSGLVRRLETPTTSGISTLKLTKTSRASATQRAGRAGRIAAGQVIRLYTKGDFDTRPEHDSPEILRLDFSDALLLLHGCGIDSTAQISLLDAPEAAKVAAANQLLVALGAIDAQGRMSPLGRRMLPLGIHPRLARLALACADCSLHDEGAMVAALLAERDIRLENRAQTNGAGRRRADVVAGKSDLLELVELFEWAVELGFNHRALLDIGVEPRSARTVQQAYVRLKRLLTASSTNTARSSTTVTPLDATRENALATSVLLAFPDRIAKRRLPQKPEFVLRNGQSARLSEQSVVVDASFIVAIDVDERRAPGRPPETIIRLASAIDPNWLLDVAAEQLQSEDELIWTDPPGRVEERSRIRLGSLTIEESRRAARPGPNTAKVLLDVAKERGLLRSQEVASLFRRLSLLKETGIVADLPENLESTLEAATATLLLHGNSLEGVDGPSLARTIADTLAPPLPESLRRDAPEHVTLPGRRNCQIHYEPQQSPWIESRLQDFFGMSETPTILKGRVQLTIHLLAPNLRAVQITNDLKGFWSTHYPTLRRQLMRRYPKHLWPEDGLTATPPEPRPMRLRRQ